MEIISRSEARKIGLKYYYTGKPCPRGHYERKSTKWKYCCGCVREKSFERTRKNPEENRRRASEWQRANKDRANKSKNDWYHANKEKAYASTRRWEARNPEKVKAKNARFLAKKKGNKFMKYAAVQFGSQRDDDTKCYDYAVPSGLDIAAGDEAIIESRGSEKRVFVRAIKDETTVPAEKIKFLLRKAEPRKEETEEEGGAE